MSGEANIWPKRITVDKRIVSVLSQSTYDNFPRALKELITNSYDADAKKVTITIDLKKESIILEDNGRGMDAEDFEFYLRIAGKTRKKEDNLTPLGRKIIGQFGVGFLSVFPFFKVYGIETKKAGTSQVLNANIPLSKYFTDEKRFVDVGSILINGGVSNIPSKSNQSYTKIILTGFNDLTRSFFYPTTKKDHPKVNKAIVETYDGIEKLKWILSDDLPLKFEKKEYNEIFDLVNDPQFEVSVNGTSLHRKIYGDHLLETHKGDFKQIGNIKFKYCIVTPRKSVKPYEARYLKIRNLNVGVGDQREHFGIAHGATRSRMHWLSGEVHIMEGMNDLIKISRDGFNFSNDFEELKDFFTKKLNFYSNRLEAEAGLEKEIKQTGKEFRVNNLNLLNPEAITKKIQQYKEEGKEIFVPEGLQDLSKYIVLDKKRYIVTSEKWNSENSPYPACKVENNKIILNASYPLFQGKKYTDLFVKLHMLLLINFKNKTITSAAYKTLVDDVLVYYSDYNK